ncbi:REC8 meiotic recombination protein b [Chanos chanos]|uniref:REC8 meiotic recombination protein b n=1 Tax=Chanos chanos TaxID=29144 RepID=A0A6J2UUL5_CHACN|nr:meiotic recombination protein REC8 homolog [Chanos chanos]
MFYYPIVLQRHTGCFSTIWLAATKGVRMSRRELLKVNVGKTCEDIIDYVTVQVPPLHPGLPRPRFSLYLSSQLQYGVVIVYHRQCAFLLEEIQQTIERLLRSERHVQIDMQEPDRLALNMPDSLFLMQEAEGALEPFFGVMGEGCELPSPCRLPQFMEAGSPERPLVTSTKDSPLKGLTACPESITIRESEPITISAAEFGGAELPEATVQEINMLMEQTDRFLGEVEEKEKEREAEEERTRELEAAMVSVDQLKESATGDSVWLLDEGTGRPAEVAVDAAVMEKTPPPVTMPTTAEASEREKELESSSSEVFLPKKRGRRRQLIFADRDTQISQDALREQINHPLAETQPLSQVLVDTPWASLLSLADLFQSPCSLLFHPDLKSLWKRCDIPAALSHPRKSRPAEEPSNTSEMDGEREVEERERERGKRESSIREVVRESLESGLLLSESSAASDVLLEVSKVEGSQELVAPGNRWSPIEEAPVRMTAILEEQVEMPEKEITLDIGALSTHNLLSMLKGYIQHFGKVPFRSLLPPEAKRSTAAHVFYSILELLCEGQLRVSQDEPYHSITVTLGPLHTHS